MKRPQLRSGLVVGALILLAYALRMLYLGERGLWYDEAFSILFATRSPAEMVAGTLTQVGGAAADVHPLLYYWLLHWWLGIAGPSAFAARYVSVVFGVATLPVAFRIARMLLGDAVAVPVAVMVAVAPFHIAYSQEARMYAPLTFWSTLALYGWVRYRSRGQTRWLAIMAGAGALALYCHNLAILIFAALGLWTVVDAVRRRDPRLLRATILAGLAMLLLWLPWLLVVPSQVGMIERVYWVPPPTITTLVQTALVLAFGFDNAAPPAGLVPLLLLASILVAVLAGFEAVRSLRDRRGAGAHASIGLVVALAGLPAVILLAVSQWHSVYVNRALLPAFVWYVILVAWALGRMPRAVGAGVAIGLGCLVIAVLPSHYAYDRFPRSPFKAAAAALAPRLKPGDIILHDNKLSFFPMYYYDRDLPDEFLADPPGAGSDTLLEPTQRALEIYPVDFNRATADATRVWFVIFQNAQDQAGDQGQPHANLARMEQRFRQVSLERYNDLNVYLFAR